MNLHDHPATTGLSDDQIAELHRQQAANLDNAELAAYLTGVARLIDLPEDVRALIAEAAHRLLQPATARPEYDWTRFPGDDSDPTPHAGVRRIPDSALLASLPRP